MSHLCNFREYFGIEGPAYISVLILGKYNYYSLGVISKICKTRPKRVMRGHVTHFVIFGLPYMPGTFEATNLNLARRLPAGRYIRKMEK